MKRKILSGLAAITAAAGLSCAKDMPVYNQSEIIVQTNELTATKEVYWNAGRMKLVVRVIKNGVFNSETVWTRDEPVDSGQCSRVSLYVSRPVEMHMPDGETLDGAWIDYLLDENCDRTFEEGMEVYTFSNDPAVIEEQTQQFRRYAYDSYMRTITSNFNVEQLITDWHRAKEL